MFRTANGLVVKLQDLGSSKPAIGKDGEEFRAWTSRFVANGETLLYCQVSTEFPIEERKREDRRALDEFLARSGDSVVSED